MTTHLADTDLRLRERLTTLEREILALRAALAPQVLVPVAPFEALTVIIGGAKFALPLEPIAEIIQPVWCEPLPDAPAFVLGTFQYGRAAVPVIDLGRRIRGQSAGLTPAGYFVIARCPELTALTVDGVGDIVHIEPSAVAPPPADLVHAVFLTGLVTGLPGGTLPLLSLERLGREFVIDGRV